jgi:Leucine-rich repeat (LRR) protein
LPLEIGKLTELIEISIKRSDLSAGPVPDSIGLCTKLVKVILEGCKLNGKFPVGLQTLTSLGILSNAYQKGYLALNTNDLSGNVPDWLCELETLSYLKLNYNRFNGIIPSCIGKLKLLKYLGLAINAFSGELPIGLCDLVNLEKLNIFDTYVGGSILFSNTKDTSQLA